MKIQPFDQRQTFQTVANAALKVSVPLTAAVVALPAWAGHGGNGFFDIVVVVVLIVVTLPAFVVSAKLAARGITLSFISSVDAIESNRNALVQT